MEQFVLLIKAIKGGSTELFDKYFKEEYLERKAEYSWRPIHFACRAGHADIVKLLIDKKCDIEASISMNNMRPIHLACEKGNIEIVKLLIEYNCNIEACTKGDWRPCHLACWEGNIEIVKMLVSQKCDIEAKDMWNWRPIHFASDKGHLEIVKFLINQNCDITADTKENWQAIHLASWAGHTETARLLFDQISDIESCDELRISLKKSCETIQSNEISYILNGRKLLLACKNGFVENFSSLLLNADIEYCDQENKRPIHWACENGNKGIVKLLIKKNCNITAKDKFNLSPLDIAKKNNNKKLIQILNTEKLERQISMMGLKCQFICDHKLCPKSLKLKTFDIGTEIGNGAFGEVFKCKGSGIDKEFAVKRINLKYINTKYIEGNIDNFIHSLNHLRIVQYYGAIQILEHLYIFMEFLPEGSLEDKIEKEKFIEIPDVIRYSKQILECLEFLHGNKIIHRDLKPANILMDHENNIKVADFGLGRSLIRTDGKATKAHTFLGTPNFMAPEVILVNDVETYSVSADIWSLGATVINMITDLIVLFTKRTI